MNRPDRSDTNRLYKNLERMCANLPGIKVGEHPPRHFRTDCGTAALRLRQLGHQPLQLFSAVPVEALALACECELVGQASTMGVGDFQLVGVAAGAEELDFLLRE